MSLFGGIHFNEFLSTHEEWHALVIGIGYGFCPWPPGFPMSAVLRSQVIKEHHYYVSGRVIGFAALFIAIVLVLDKVM